MVAAGPTGRPRGLRPGSRLSTFSIRGTPQMAQRYLIAIPTSAVTIEGRARKVILISKDSVVDVPLPLNGLQGLIEVTVNGGTVLMFAEDIRERGKPVSLHPRKIGST